jgi:erythromycin esterase-like protein
VLRRDGSLGLAHSDGSGAPAPITVASNAACIDALDRLGKLAARRAPLEIEMRLARLRGHQEFYSTLHDHGSRYGARDESQATIILRLREMRFPGHRAVVIAHASHVAYRTSALANNSFVSFGERLRGQLGDRYRAIAISGFEVAVSRVQGKNEYRHEEPNSVERLVHELELPFAFVDLRSRTPSSLVEHGAAYHLGFDQLIPRDHFDGILVVDAAGGNLGAR